jgi:mannose-6-phosphate isomerase-like protein (cupin superfamily)
MAETTKKWFVGASEHEWESWNDPHLRRLSPIFWKTLISADRTDSYGLTMGICEIPPGERLIRHRHPEEEIYYIMAGEGQMEIDDQSTFISAGMSVFIPGNAEHAFSNTGAHSLRFIYVFPADAFQQIQYTFVEGMTDEDNVQEHS